MQHRGYQDAAGFKDAMRNVPSAVTLITTRDMWGQPHGMAASAVISVSMEPASVLVAVNRTASVYPVLQASRKMCVNFLGRHQQHLLEPFSRSELRNQRFGSADWRDVSQDSERLPWLPLSRAVVFGDVDCIVDYGTHTLFISKVSEVILPDSSEALPPPMVWLAGRCAGLI